MEVREKLILSGLVLATGVSGAMWFRKAEGDQLGVSPALSTHTVRREEFRPNPVPVAASPLASAKPVPVVNDSPATAAGGLPATGRATLEGSPPPRFAAEYQPFYERSAPETNPGPSSAFPSATAPAFSSPIQAAPNPPRPMIPVPPMPPRQNPAVSTPPWQPPTSSPIGALGPTLPAARPTNPTSPTNVGPTLPAATPNSPNPPATNRGVTTTSYAPDGFARRHKIADGETLAMLAEHYLGSSTRRLEIFQANRDLLRDPELLPIGAEIVIPTGPSPW